MLPQSFNVQHTAKYRWYRYEWFLSKYRSVFTPFNAVREHRSVSISAMQTAVESLVGTHHFETFQSPSIHVPSALCTVLKAAITQPTPTTVWFDIIANRFVYKMVRNLAAAVWKIGLNPDQYTPHSLSSNLAQRNRSCSPVTAPSKGLTLMGIVYELGMNTTANSMIETTQQTSLNIPLFWTDPLTQLLNKTLTKEFSYDENIFCQA
jgi:tRNA pseudouridine(38-40) synthase